MFKRSLYLLIGLSIMLSIFGGCGSIGKSANEENQAATEQSKTANEANIPAQPSGKPIELIVFSASGNSVEEYNERFQMELAAKKFPQYSIKYIQQNKQQNATMDALVAAKTPIDIYWGSLPQFINVLIPANMQFDMSQLIKKHNVNLSSIEPNSLKAIEDLSAGKIVGLPVINSNLVMYYNKDIFNKFGVPYPSDGMNWDQALEMSKKITREDSGVIYLGMGVDVHFLQMNPLSLPLVDPGTKKPTINNGKWNVIYDSAFIQPYKSDTAQKYVQTTLKGKSPSEPAFITKTLAMLISLWNNKIVTSPELAGTDYNIAAMPTLKEAPGIGSQPYPVYFGVTVTSEHKDEAMEVIKFLISEEHQLALSKAGTMSILTADSVKKVFGSGTKYADKNLQAVYYDKFAPTSAPSFESEVVAGEYSKIIPDLMQGKTDMNSAFRLAEENANQALELKKK